MKWDSKWLLTAAVLVAARPALALDCGDTFDERRTLEVHAVTIDGEGQTDLAPWQTDAWIEVQDDGTLLLNLDDTFVTYEPGGAR